MVLSLRRSLAFAWLSCVAVVVAHQQVPLHNGPSSDETAASLHGTQAIQGHKSHELLHLHRELIETESITGNEKAVGNYLAAYLRDHSLTVEKQEVAKDRFNILAYPGKARESKILVSSHIDTVPPYWPWKLSEDGLEIWGRGSVDAKACVAAQTIAVLDLLKDNSSGVGESDIGLLFVVGEEKSGDGMRFFSENKPTNYTAVVFGEPTEGKLATGHKGILGWSVKIKGKASHSGYPSLGLSANNILIEAVNTMLKLAEDFPSSEKYGNSTLNVGRLDGGVAANVVAEAAQADFALRIAGGSPVDIREQITQSLEPLKERTEAAGGELALEFPAAGYGPVDLDHDVPGFDTITVNYGTDVPNLKGDHKKYLYGPGSILVAHSDHEHLKITELKRAVDDYKKIILSALGKD